MRRVFIAMLGVLLAGLALAGAPIVEAQPYPPGPTTTTAEAVVTTTAARAVATTVAPTVTQTTRAPAVVVAGLAFTGADLLGIAAAAAVLLVLGIGFMRFGRRRGRADTPTA